MSCRDLVPFQLFVSTFLLHSITTLATRQVGNFGPSIFPLDPPRGREALERLGVVSGSAETSASLRPELGPKAQSSRSPSKPCRTTYQVGPALDQTSHPLEGHSPIPTLSPAPNPGPQCLPPEREKSEAASRGAHLKSRLPPSSVDPGADAGGGGPIP